MNPDRQHGVASLLFDYVKSPALRHLRDPHSIHRLARDIVTTLDRASSVWKEVGARPGRDHKRSGSLLDTGG